MTDAINDMPGRRDWVGLATLGCAALACLASVTGLVVILGGRAPAVTIAAQAAPVELHAAGEIPRVPLAVELLLPHLPRAAPYPRSFATAVALAAGDAEATRLMPPLAAGAAEGTPTLRQLAEEFGPAADAVVLAEMGYGPDAGWFARNAARTMRLGADFGAAGTPALAALRDAAERLGNGDAPGAEAALAALPADSAAPMAVWRNRLARRITADAAQTLLAALALSRAQAVPR